MIVIFFIVFKQYNTFLTPSVQVKEDILIDVFFSYIITTQPSQEKTEPAENADKVTYENEINPTIDEMLKDYDEIWNQDWKAILGEGNKDPESLDKDALKEKMEEAQKSIKLSDQKLSNALASLNEIESKLGVSRN